MNELELELRIQDLTEGRIRSEELVELEQELLGNPTAHAFYMEYMMLHHLLQLESESLKAIHQPVVPVDLVLSRQKRKNLYVAITAAAALILCSLIVFRLMIRPEVTTGVTFRTSPGTEFSLTHSRRGADGEEAEDPEAQVLRPGSRLLVNHGAVESSFSSGVRFIVVGPADVTLHDDSTLFVNEGVAWFQVPKEAVGFTVKTKELDIVDLGTEFGVIAGDDDHDEAHVFKGKVRVTAKRLRKESEVIEAGQARRIDPVGRLDKVEPTPFAFLTKLPGSLPYLHWSFDDAKDCLSVKTENLSVRKEIVSTVNTENNDQSGLSAVGKFGGALKMSPGKFVETNWDGIAGSAPRTLAYWIKLPKGEKYAHPIVGWGYQELDSSNSTEAFYSFVQTGPGNKVVTGISFGGYWVMSNTEIADSQWHHVVYVYTGKSDARGEPEVICYIDGQREEVKGQSQPGVKKNEKGEISINTATARSGGDPLSIFGHKWEIIVSERSHIRALDELYLFKGALSEEEVLNLYQHNSTTGPSP